MIIDILINFFWIRLYWLKGIIFNRKVFSFSVFVALLEKDKFDSEINKEALEKFEQKLLQLESDPDESLIDTEYPSTVSPLSFLPRPILCLFVEDPEHFPGSLIKFFLSESPFYGLACLILCSWLFRPLGQWLFFKIFRKFFRNLFFEILRQIPLNIINSSETDDADLQFPVSRLGNKYNIRKNSENFYRFVFNSCILIREPGSGRSYCVWSWKLLPIKLSWNGFVGF